MHIDLIFLVAEHLEPNPALYYRLATVSKDFYSVFTSDRVWKHLNPYAVDSNIIQSFWKACNGDPVRAKVSTFHWLLPHCPEPIDNNLFSWLGTLIHTSEENVFAIFEENSQILSCLFHIKGQAIMHATNRIKQNRDLVLIAIKNSCFILDSLPESIQDDREIVMLSLQGWVVPDDMVNWRRPPLQYVSARLRDDPEVVMLACEAHGACFFDASSRIKEDRSMVEKVVAAHGDSLLHSNFIDDRDMVLLAAKTSWEVLCSNKTFVDDKEIIMAAVSIPGSLALSVASKRLQKDREVVMTALKSGARVKSIHPDLQDDKELALALVAFPTSLHLVSSKLQDDFDVVLKAVSVSGLDLRFASTNLKDNIDIVMTAVTHNGVALEFASPRLRNNRDVAMAAIETDSEALCFVSPQIKETDFEFVFKAIGLNGSLLYLIPPDMRWSSRKLIKMALRGCGDSLQHLALCQRDDEELVSLAVAQNGMALRYANERFASNYKILSIAVAQDPRVLFMAPQNLREDRSLMKIAIASNPMALKYAPNLCGDEELTLMAIRSNCRAYKLVDDSLKNSLEFNIKAVEAAGQTFCFLPEKFRSHPHIQEHTKVSWISPHT